MTRILYLWRLAAASLLCGGLLGTLAGCSGDELTRNFGLSRDVPDEFQVTTRAPLSMPPDFTLRPPQPGAARPQELSPTAAAEAALVPQTAIAAPAVGSSSPGQQALLAASGAPAPADTRARLASDRPEPSNQSLTDELLFWKKAPLPGTPLDPVKEAERLRQNAALGQSVQTGDTPIIQRSQKGLLDSIF